ncbi:MAG TPA: hypothetical protein VIB39_05500 [Candidatus Angelobacter sp.]|jgi:hypothetical protein
MENDHDKDFLLQRRPATPIQRIALVIFVAGFLGFALGIEAITLSNYREAPGALSIVVLLLGSLVCLLFLRLAWLSVKRIFARGGTGADRPL